VVLRLGLDISLLETFTLVADLGSFSSAARRLGITQPAVSLQIKSLEKELAAPLIDRSHGKVVLTPAGRTAYAHAKKILTDRELMISDIPRATGRVAGQLLLGASTIPGEYLLPPVLSEFRKMYPEVTISLEIRDSAGVLQKLRCEEIELGFTGARPGGDVAHRRFGEDRLVLITPPHHPLSTKRKVSLETLAGERYVNRGAGSGTRSKVESVMVKHGVDPDSLDVVAEMGSTQAVISAVQAGMGVSVVSRKAAEYPAKAGLIAMKKLPGTDLSRGFFVAYSKEHPLSVAADAFLKTACDAK
jgi:LysR family transcriptional regulator, low CO2-responsive transcriptional regulator